MPHENQGVASSDLVFLLYFYKNLHVLLPSSPFCRCSFTRMVFKGKCVVLSDLFFRPSMFKQIRAILCVFFHLSRIVWQWPLSGSLAFVNVSRALWYIVWRNDGPGLGPRDWFFFITYPGFDNMSIMSLLNCRLFSVGCMHFPRVQYTITISQYKAQSGHCLFEEVS